MGRGGQILKLLASENIDGNNVDLGVAVLASLGGGHLNNLARAALDDNKTVLPQSRALHGEGGRGTGISRLESDLVLSIVSVLRPFFRKKPRWKKGLQCAQKRGGKCGAVQGHSSERLENLKCMGKAR